jgi:hypothetical protein
MGLGIKVEKLNEAFMPFKEEMYLLLKWAGSYTEGENTLHYGTQALSQQLRNMS